MRPLSSPLPFLCLCLNIPGIFPRSREAWFTRMIWKWCCVPRRCLFERSVFHYTHAVISCINHDELVWSVCGCVCENVHARVWTFVDILFYVGPIQTGLNTQVWCIKISQHLSVWTSDLISMPFWTVEGRCTDFWVSFISWMSPTCPI